METKKLSRTVRKRLNKKKKLESVTSTDKSLPEILPPKATIPEQPPKQKKKVIKTEIKTVKETTSTATNESKPEKKTVKQTTATVAKESKPEPKPTTTTTTTTESKSNRKRNSKNKVVYINSNYGKNDSSGVGGLIQAGLMELRKESERIKTASDLTESQAHIVKRQITRLHDGDGERVFKRPKHYDKTIGEATKELKQLMEKQKAKFVVGKQK